MADDGELRINTKVDTKGLDKGLNDVNKKLKDNEKGFKGAAGKASDFIKNIKGIAAVTVAIAAIKKVTAALNECTQAFRVQQKAEAGLDVAARNNPYLSTEGVKRLKEFAGELQNISEIGDETTIKVMSQLAAQGRTEEQIKNTLSVAVDYAAATGQDLQAAADALIKTYDGNAAALKKQIPALQNLTEEELKQGKALEVVKNSYKDFAKETASIEVQLSNAWGDFKENIGKGWARVTQPVKQFFLDVLKDINKAKAEADALKGAKQQNAAGTGTAATFQTELEAETKALEEMATRAERARAILEMTNKEIKKTSEYTVFTTYSESSNPILDFKNEQQELIKAYEAQEQKVKGLEEEYTQLAAAEQIAAENAAKAAKAAEDAKTQQQRDETALNIMKQNADNLDKTIAKIKLEAKFKGEEVDKQEILNAMTASYIDLVTTSSLVTENNPYSQKRLKELEEYAAGVENLTEITAEYESKLDDMKKNTSALIERLKEDSLSPESKLVKDIEAQLKAVIEEGNRAQQEDQAAEFASYYKQRIDLEHALTEAMQKEAEARKQNEKEALAEQMQNLNGYFSQFENITSNFAELMQNSIAEQNSAELAALSQQYTDGLISYEDYCDKKEELQKKAALSEYRLQLAQWAASLAAATANIAEGVSKALTAAYPLNLINASLVGAAGAVQIASITASKPKRPSFFTGGVIGGVNGASYGADNTIINARNGEMVLNAIQQARLLNMANGHGASGTVLNVPVTIENNAGAQVSAQMTAAGLKILVDQTVNASFQQGKYTKSMNYANGAAKGVNIL